jgi:hypothetical protein
VEIILPSLKRKASGRSFFEAFFVCAMTHSRRVVTAGVISLPLRIALWGSPLLVGGAWLVQWRGRFPPLSSGASLTAKTLVLGSVLASISAVCAVYRLVRTPTPASYAEQLFVEPDVYVIAGD